jgi:selenide,water dikinase
MLCGLNLHKSPNLIIGLDSPDDAAVYKINDTVAMVQTVDFFTPIVDDPYLFGQIAAANSISDIYAMGAEPVTAMNLVGFPSNKLDSAVLKDILRGGSDKMAEAGVCLVGGHSIDDHEIKYGLSVTGFVHPDKILAKGGAKTGDAIFLTKTLGVGIISTALKGGAASEVAAQKAADSMSMLNRAAGEAVQEAGVNACTDITGYGLIGHAMEVAKASNKTLRLNSLSIPCFEEALEYASDGFVPGGALNNRNYYHADVSCEGEIASELMDVFYDPQTSGGLLVTLDVSKKESFMNLCKEKGVSVFHVGEVLGNSSGNIIIKS